MNRAANICLCLAWVFALCLWGRAGYAVEKWVKVENPDQLSEFSLRTANDRPFRRDDFMGHWSIVVLGYTSCPDVCPFVLGNLRAISREWLAQGKPLSRFPLQIIFVAVDPGRDTKRLSDYVQHFGDNVVGVTGDIVQLQRFANATGGAFELGKANTHGDYSVKHSAFSTVISPDAKVIAQLNPPLPVTETIQFFRTLIASTTP